MTSREAVAQGDLDTWLHSHHAWRVLDGHLVGSWDIGFNDGVAALARASTDVSRLNHHPKVTVEYRNLRVESWTHDRNAITALDFELAECFDAAIATVIAN